MKRGGDILLVQNPAVPNYDSLRDQGSNSKPINRIPSSFSTGVQRVLIGAAILLLSMIGFDQWRLWGESTYIATLEVASNVTDISPEGDELLAVMKKEEGKDSPHGAAVLRLASGKVRKWIRKGEPDLLDAIFSPCGKYIVTIEEAGSQGVKFLDRNTLELVFTLDKPVGRFYSLKMSRNGRWLGSVGASGEYGLYIWNVEDHSGRWLAAGKSVMDFAFAPESDEAFLFGYRQAGFDIWDLQHGKSTSSVQVGCHTEYPCGTACISDDGIRLASFFTRGSHVYNIKDRTAIMENVADGDRLFVDALSFAQDDTVFLASGLLLCDSLAFKATFPFFRRTKSRSPHLVAWETDTWTVIRRWRLPDRVGWLFPVPQTNDFISIDYKGRIRRWSIK